eukprot:6704919-Pyramimonas_sp.AAC.1
MAASKMPPVALGCGADQSVARGSRSCDIITTSRTLSAGGVKWEPVAAAKGVSERRVGLAWAE